MKPMTDLNKTQQSDDLQTQFDAALGLLSAKRRKFVVEYLRDLNAKQAAKRAGYAAENAHSLEVMGSRLLSFVEVAQAVSLGMELKCMGPTEVLARLSDEARGSMADFLRVDEEEIFIETSIAVLTDDERFRLAMGGGQAVRELLASSSSIDDEDTTDTTDTTDTSDTTGTSDTNDTHDEESKEPAKAVRISTATIKRAVARLDLLQAEDKLHLIKEYRIDDKGAVSIKLYDAQAAKKLIGQKHGLFVERHEHSGPKGGPIPVSAIDLAEARKQAAAFEQEMTGE